MTEPELNEHYARLQKDLITGHLIKMRMFPSRRRVVELCQGVGPISGRPMYRVSVLFFNEDGTHSKNDRVFKVMFSLEKAEMYYNETLDYVLALDEDYKESQR